jgi:hypothetical protein
VYVWVRRFLVLRQIKEGYDGQTCEICKRQQDTHGRTGLIIEHIDNDQKNNDPANLRLAHQSCNVIKDPPHSKERRLSQDVVQESVCVKVNPAPKVRSQDGFAANKNRMAEPLLRRWVYAILKANRDSSKSPQWLVREGSAYVGANPVTVDRYLDKMLSEIFGMLVVTSDDKTGEAVVFKYLSDYDLTVDELELKYPWTGAVTSELFSPIRKAEGIPDREGFTS